MNYNIGDYVTLAEYWKSHRWYGKVFKVERIEAPRGRSVWFDQDGQQHNFNLCWQKVDNGVPW